MYDQSSVFPFHCVYTFFIFIVTIHMASLIVLQVAMSYGQTEDKIGPKSFYSSVFPDDYIFTIFIFT